MIEENPKDICPKCNKQILPEDTLTSSDGEIFYHVDCDDPTLSKLGNLILYHDK